MSLDHQSYPTKIFLLQFDTSIRIRKYYLQYFKDSKETVSQYKIWLTIILVLCSAILTMFVSLFMNEERKQCEAI